MDHRCKKIFVAVYDGDVNIVNRCIIEPLTERKHHGLTIKCCTDQDVKPGSMLMTGIAEMVEECHHTFVVLTKKSLKKGWIKYETWLALQKSLRDCKLCLALILFDVDISVVLDAQFGLLTQSMIIPVDTNSNSWQTTMIEKMIHHIKEATPVKPIQIAASLSVGQAWSHFTGYAQNVLPSLEACIKSSEWYQNNESVFPVLEFNLIPQSANSKSSLTDYSEDIHYEGDLPLIKAQRGSFKDRPYRLSVYRIHDRTTDKQYFFVGQIPNTLSILSKLEKRKIHVFSDDMNENKNESCDNLVMSEGERKLQVDRFYYTYNRLLNHQKNQECNNRIKFIRFDKDKDLYRLLLKSVKEECELPVQGNSATGCLCLGTSVCVMNEETDAETAEEVKTYLRGNNIELVEYTALGASIFESFSEAVSKAQWLVIILSDKSFKLPESLLMMFRIRTFLYEKVMKHKLCVVPILVDIEEHEIPQDVYAVTCLKKSEKKYRENLLEILNYGNVHMEATVSSTDVHQGLAWAYVLNYLEVTLEDLQGRLEEIRGGTGGRKLYKKLFITVPSSCTSKTLRALDRDENGQLIDESFYQLKEIHYRTKAVGGVKNRDYQLITYVIKTEDMEVVVAVEYPNAVLCLQEMSQLSLLSGLSSKDLHQEAWKFKELAQNIIDNTPTVKNKAKFIYYDDSRLTVADAMKQVLQDEDDYMFL